MVRRATVRRCEGATVRRRNGATVRRCAFALMLLALAPLAAQTPAFEAASVKPNKSGTPGMEIRVTPNGGFIATNAPLLALIRQAFGVQDYQLIDVPGWAASERFDIVARAPGTTQDQLPTMLQGLLTDRFGLVVRRDRMEMPMYAAVMARADGRLGPRMQPSTPATAAYCASQRLPPGSRPAADPARLCGTRQSLGTASGGDAPLAALFRFVSQQAGRAIVDRTSLTGNFDYDLTWTPDQFANRETPAVVNGNAIDPQGPSLFTALQEQLGLKMDPQRGMVDVVVVARLERPTED
jgi:uncharacterized protein (TIGR03435 family)